MENNHTPVEFKSSKVLRTGKDYDSGSSSDEDDAPKDEDDKNDCEDEKGSGESDDESGSGSEALNIDVILASKKVDPKISDQSIDETFNGQNVTVDELLVYKDFFREFEPNAGLPTMRPFESYPKEFFFTNSMLSTLSLKQGPTVNMSLSSETSCSWLLDHIDYRPDHTLKDLRRLYCLIQQNVKRVSPFVKIPYPDLCLAFCWKRYETMMPNVDRSHLRWVII